MFFGMTVVMAFQSSYPVRSVDDLQLREEIESVVKKALHTSAVDDKNIGVLQFFHIAGGKLIIVETSGLWLRHTPQIDAGNFADNILGDDIDRVK